jgi:Lysophospholipase L1 and related esterases
VVLFIPFKSQVYFPLLLRSFATADLERYFQFYFRQSPTSLDAKKMFQNRLAQNDLMRQFCDSEHIPFIDVTAALQTEVESGKNVYFPDESHWNDDGHAVAAREIAAFLKSHGLDQNRE